MNARPFTAFRLHMSDGGHVDVISPESVAVAVGRRTAVICFLEEDDRWQMVYYMHVTRAELLKPSGPPFSGSPPEPTGQPTPTPA